MKPLLCTSFAFFLCSTAIPAQQPSAPGSVPASDQAEAVQGSNAFAADLYAQLRAQPGNLFFSPESISTAFAMAYAGARGKTAIEMERALHFTLPPDRLHPAMGALLAAMNAPHKEYELRVADALWAQQDESFLDRYLKLVQSNYGAGFRKVDFKTLPETARKTINRWIEHETNDKISNMLKPGAITPATRLVLTNAIYFKGSWLDPFNKANTRLDDFHVSETETVKAPMMIREGGYRYCDFGSFEALELPYEGNELSMVVLLPKQIAELPALEQSFTAPALSKWLQKLHFENKVNLGLPRFTITGQFELSKTLATMGMPLAFSGAADFSGITGSPDLMISAAIHKAYVDVNETGTEAAAATSAIFGVTAIQERHPPIPFIADHPFLFLIRETRSGSILFLGRVTDPSK
jgi:serpin B